MTGQITIIGLGQIGGSAGLALKEAKSSLRRVGFDKEIAILRAAETLDVVDATARRLPDAIRDADIVLMSLPLAEMPEMLKHVAQYLKENAVIMETTPVKRSLAKSLRDLIPEGRFFVGLVPSVTVDALTGPETGLKAARPDLFKRTVMMVDMPSGAPEEVEQLAVNFVKLLGAKPLLADMLESDGIMAAAHILPQLAAAALLEATIDRPGWSDGRKLAGRPFVSVTGGLGYYDDPASLKAAVLSDPPATIHALDALIDSLQALRDDIEREDEPAVSKRLQQAFDARERWLNERGAAAWLSEGGQAPDLPDVGEQMMQALFGSRIIDRMKGKKKPEKPK